MKWKKFRDGWYNSFYNSINDQYRNYHIHHQIQEKFSLIIKLSESSNFFHSYIHSKKVGRPSVGPLRYSNGSLTADPKIMCEIFANEFSSVYFTGNLNSSAPR